MQKITYERKIGNVTIQFVFSAELDQYGSLAVKYKRSDEAKKSGFDGWNRAEDFKNGAVRFYGHETFAGKKADGVQVLDADIVSKVEAMKAQLLAEREQKIEQYKAALVAGTGKMRLVMVGVDYPHLAVYPDSAFEDAVGLMQAYRALDAVFPDIMNAVIRDEAKEGTYTVDEMKLQAPDLMRRVFARIEKQHKIEVEHNEREEYLAKTGKTWVSVHHCLECGTWQITGGKSGRLDKSVWMQAMDELRNFQSKQYSAQSNDGKQLMSSISMANETTKMFDLETDHFVYVIVSEDMDSHGC